MVFHLWQRISRGSQVPYPGTVLILTFLLAGCGFRSKGTMPERIAENPVVQQGGIATNTLPRIQAGSKQEFLVNVGDNVFFSVDSSDLSADAKAILDQQIEWLQRYPQYRVILEGHADERGTREYNLALSARRAQVVRKYLIGKGIPPARLRAIAYGKERPVATCNDISCWSQNRRVVTALENFSGR